MFSKNQSLEKDMHSKKVLREISQAENANGGTTTMPCIRATLRISIEICPTTACTNRC